MPGCESSNENFWTAMDEEARVVSGTHPDWEQYDIKVEVARRLRPKFKQDIAAIKNEKAGIPEGEGLDITLTSDGDIFFVKYGRTLTELNERTRILTPKQYHPEDAITNAAIREAFAQGANKVVTSYWRPGEDHRDFVIMELDRKTGKGVSKTVNAEALTGKTFGIQEMSKQAEKMFSGLEIHFLEEKVFIATDVSLDKSQLNAKLQIERQQEQITYEQVIDNSKETLIDVISHTKEQAAEIEPEFSAETILQSILSEKKNEHIVLALSTEPAYVAQEDLPVVWKKQAEELLHITPDQSEALLVEVTETWMTMQGVKEIISFVSDTGVGIAAAFYVKDWLTLTDTIQQENQTVQKDVVIIEFIVETDMMIGAGVFALHELAVPTENIELTKKESDAVFSFFASEQQSEQIVEKQILDSVDVVALENTIEFVRAIDALPVVEQKKAIVQEKEKVENTIIQIWEAITVDKPAVASIHALTELVDLEPKDEHEKQFSFAFAVWIMLKLMNYHSALETLEAFVKPDHDSPLEIRIQKQKPEGLIQKETGQWLLFSIIWYLAMIREQGMHTQQAPPVQKKKKAKEVIIFAYTS